MRGYSRTEANSTLKGFDSQFEPKECVKKTLPFVFS